MGQSESTASRTSQHGKHRAHHDKHKRRRLVEFYEVGHMLGQGAFGIVYACKPIGTHRECAVKMVDKVETPLDKIMEEANLLQKMDHENVIKCHDVFYEKCFVCIVMERLKGGDLIVAMQEHWKAKGKIPYTVTNRLIGQMGASLKYLHGLYMIHRDVKGDNYLTDRIDITDEKCHIVLTDFGTCLEIKTGQRLHEISGTKIYWSPEFHKLNYSFPVDIWALGVLVYGFLCGRFPFKNEAEANKKKLKFSSDTPVELQNLCTQMLEVDEHKRLTADKVAEHGSVTKAPESSTQEQNGDALDEGAMREIGADHAVTDRRGELVDRLLKSDKDKVSDSAHIWKDSFTIKDPSRSGDTRYEWWTEEHVNNDVLGSVPDACGTGSMNWVMSPRVAKPLNVDKSEKDAIALLKSQLEDHHIDTSKFGKENAKTLEELSSEVQNGKAILMLDATTHKKLVRVVDVVALRICLPGSSSSFLGDSNCCCRDAKTKGPQSATGSVDKYLVESSQKLADGRERAHMQLPGSKKLPHENTRQTVNRIAKEDLGLDDHAVVFDFWKTEIFERHEESHSYPGVDTVYRMEIVGGRLASIASTSDEWSQKESSGKSATYKWMSAEECESNHVRLHALDDENEASALIQAPVGMKEEELTAYLREHKVDLSQFGKGKAKTLQDISNELRKGESSLVVDSDGSIIRYVDVVLLKLFSSKSKNILVQTEHVYEDGTKHILNRLPAIKRRPDENQFFSAKNICREKLEISDNHITCSTTDVEAVEEERPSMAYPGLRTVYRKRIVTATLT